MKIVVASCSIIPRSTRFISWNRARAVLVFALTITWAATSTLFAQQAPPNFAAPGGAPGAGKPQAPPNGNAPSGGSVQTPGARGDQDSQKTQNERNAPNEASASQGASTHSVNIAGKQIAPFFQIPTNANSPVVGEQLTILRLVYGINSPTERSRRLVAYWELSGRHAYYNLCVVYLDFVNQCAQKVESKYSSGQEPLETTTLTDSLRLVAAQRCEDARLTFLQAQYDFDAAFTSAAGRRAAMARAAYADSNSKSIGWGAAVLYIPSARPATDFYNARFEENARARVLSKEAARLNALLPLLYESLQSRANQAIREKDVLIGSFNASEISETAIFRALDRYFEAQRDALDAAIKYNQAIALYVAETTPGYVQGERFLATLNQRVENAGQNDPQSAGRNAPESDETNDAQTPKNPSAPNTSARFAPRASRQILPGFEYEKTTFEERATPTFRAPGMERWYYPGFDDENVSAPRTFANDPIVDAVSDARVAGKTEEASEQTLVEPLASSSVSSATTTGALEVSSTGSVELQPAVYAGSESASSANPSANNSGESSTPQGSSQTTETRSETTAPQTPAPTPNASDPQPSVPPTPNASGAQPPAPAPNAPGALPPPEGADGSSVPPAPESNGSEEKEQEPEKPRVFAFDDYSCDENAAIPDDELLRFFRDLSDEAGILSADRAGVDLSRITRGQAPPDPNEENAGRKPTRAQNRGAELARALFSSTAPEQESGRVVERTCSLAESLMRVPNSPDARFAAVRAYWNLQRATAQLRVESIFLATYTQAFNDANAANPESARVCLAAALGAQARVAEAKSRKRSIQVELLRLSNQSAEYGYPIPSTLPFFGSTYELGTPIPENAHTRRSGELIRSRLQGLRTLDASIPNATAAFSFDVESVVDCDILVALESLEKKRESVLLFIDSIIDLNESIAEYVSYFPADAPNEQFVEALVGRN